MESSAGCDSLKLAIPSTSPAVLQKGGTPLHLLVDAREFERLLKKHARIISLTHPGGSDKVFIKEVQFDHLDEKAIHIDFASPDEKLPQAN